MEGQQMGAQPAEGQAMGDPNAAAQQQAYQQQPAAPQAAGAAAPAGPMMAVQSPLTMQNVGGGGLDIMQMVQKVVGYLNQLDDAMKYQELNRLRMEQPQIYPLVVQSLGQQGKGPAMRPEPEQRHPMRPPEVASV